MRVGLQKTSLVNYPQRVAAAVFLPGCNLRCPYCYNAELVNASVTEGPVQNATNDYVPIEVVYAHIEKRKTVLSGLVISGGEALLSPVLPELIRRAKKAGLAVKLDTNGLLHDKLSALLHEKDLRPDLIALDIKTSLARYGELTMAKSDAAENALKKTIGLLCRMKEQEGLSVEYRTVLVPPLVGAAELSAIAEELPPDAAWFLAPFVPGHCLDPAWNHVKPYTCAEVERLVHLARTKIPRAVLR